MNANELKDLVPILTALVGLLGALLGFVKYFNYRTRKDKMEAVGTGFSHVVDALGANDEVKRRAAAILLRRFFDPLTEYGEAGTPYANEAVNVIAAILREERSSSFQKLLADGLWYAGSLRHADLQKTNLQNAYLGVKGDKSVDLGGADFYRADLSGASLKRARARGAIFYQARLQHTVFTGTDLTEASFFEADLQGARFGGAILTAADFRGARNIPSEITAHLDASGKYIDAPAKIVGVSNPSNALMRVFLSRPSVVRPQWQGLVDALRKRLAQFGSIELVEIARPDYQRFGALAEVRRLMSGCCGVVVVGLGELEIGQASWRAGTTDEQVLAATQWSSPWAQIEAGVAIGLDLPVLLVAQPAVTSGIFATDADGHLVFRVPATAELASSAPLQSLTEWHASVCERARG